MNKKNEYISALGDNFSRENGLILGTFFVYTLCAVIFFLYNDLYQYASLRIYKALFFSVFTLLLILKSFYHLLSNRVRHGYYLDKKNFIPDLKENWLNRRVVFTILMPLLGISLMMSLFGSVKTLFPMVNPFYLDVPLMEIDRALHFGFHPWELTHAVFGAGLVTEVVDFIYQTWFVLLMLFTAWMIANHGLGRVRTKFLLSYILIWGVLGTFLAVILPAAGPCFYGNFVDGVNVYSPLMGRLHEISGVIQGDNGQVGLYAILNQELLWSFYTDDYIGLGSGITAMPSMHVSFAMLVFLAVREINRKMGYAALLYLIFIQVGAVHLGWHYAVDGYVSILLTWMLWRFSGWMVGRVSKTTDFDQNSGATVPIP